MYIPPSTQLPKGLLEKSESWVDAVFLGRYVATATTESGIESGQAFIRDDLANRVEWISSFFKDSPMAINDHTLGFSE